jgi:hypothetical protein
VFENKVLTLTRHHFGDLGHRWENNIESDLRELEYEGVDWIQMAQRGIQRRTLVNTIISLRVP